MTDPTMEHPDPGDRNAAVNRYWREVLAPRIAGERADREQALLGQEDLMARVEALLFHDDPIGINFESNTDEYRSEAQTIVLRLAEATSERDVAVIVHEEFVRWFDRQIAGPIERYRSVASAIWRLWAEESNRGNASA
jgi:hypothetical protein